MHQILAILILALLIIAVINNAKLLTNSDIKEGFYTYYGYYKKYCPSCGWRSRQNCSKCTNCGYCITASGHGECVPGDSSGPYYRNDCMYYEYNSPDNIHPYSHIYNNIDARDVHPPRRWNLRKPWIGYWNNRMNRKLRTIR